jgi:hypothetical protein
MLQRIIIAVSLVSVLQLTSPALAHGKDVFGEYGLNKLPDVVKWIAKLDDAWENIVTKEERAQLLRQIAQMASDTGEIEIRALNAQAALRKSATYSADEELWELAHAVQRLRDSMIRLSTQLGKKTGQEGLDIADNYSEAMGTRGTLISSAQEHLRTGTAKDRSAAADELGEAAKIAAKARDALVLFIKSH